MADIPDAVIDAVADVLAVFAANSDPQRLARACLITAECIWPHPEPPQRIDIVPLEPKVRP